MRNGNQNLDRMVKEMCFEIHQTKSNYLVVCTTKFMNEVEAETKENPVKFGEVELKRAECVTYLGDELHEDGLSATIEATILARREKVKGSIYSLVGLWRDYRDQVIGGVLGAIQLYKTCIVSSLLNNCSTWVGMKKEQYKLLDTCLQAFLQLPVFAPKAWLRAASGVLGMMWRVWEEKLLLAKAILKQEEEVLARQVFVYQVALGLP